MGISALLNSTTLRPISLSSTVISLQTTQPLQQSSVSADTSSARLADDTYTSSNSSTSATLSSLSQSLLAGLQNYVTPTQKTWQTLQQSLASGDISGAQTALNNYTQSLPTSNLYMSSLTTPSAQFLKDLSDLGTALNRGNLADAQSVFKTAQNDQPDNVVEAMSKALTSVISSGKSDPFWMEEIVNFGISVASSSLATTASTNSSSSTNSAASSDGTSASSGGTVSSVVTAQEGFNSDLIALEGVIKECNANIGDYLQTQGYSAAAANATASALNKTDILGMLPGLAEAIGSAAGDNNMGDLTISNSSAFAHISSTNDNSGTGAVDSTSMSSMNDMFSYSLTGAYLSLNNENTQTVDNSGSVVSNKTTLAASKTAATLQESMFIQLESSMNSASIVTMNQTKNVVENFLGNWESSSTNDSGTSSNGSNTSYSSMSVYA